MKKLRLVFWSETFYPTIGGTEISLYRQIKELLRLGNEVTVISPDGSLKFLQINEKYGDYFQKIRVKGKNHIFKTGKLLKDLNDIDLLYITRVFKCDPLSHLKIIKKISSEIDTVLRVPTQGNIDAISLYPLNEYLYELGGFISLNDAITEEIKRYIKRPRIFPHRNGIPLHEFRGSKFTKKGSYLFIGRLTKTKGIPVLLRAWKKYKQLGGKKHLIIGGPFKVGSTPTILNDTKFLRRYGINYIGEPANIWEHIENIYALIIPSLREGHSNVMLEAMAFGLPIIASNIPGLKEDIAKSGAGLLFRRGDFNTLASILLEAEEDIYNFEKMSKSGPVFIRNYRTIKHTIRSFYHILRKVKRLRQEKIRNKQRI